MAITCHNLIKEFGDPPTRIIHGLNFVITDGEFVSISGRSGSGKSTEDEGKQSFQKKYIVVYVEYAGRADRRLHRN